MLSKRVFAGPLWWFERFAADWGKPKAPARAAVAPLPGGRMGSVMIVGAGPGDPDLLTVKAVKAISQATHLLHDDLVSDEILALAGGDTDLIYVGKRCGKASWPQEDINHLMAALARNGGRVVRLKSGDPMIFGRAGEEIAYLEGEGIPVSTVPGITAALAAASELGVSLTQRGIAQSVRFLTGHSRKGGLPEDVEWQSLRDPGCTLMVYMGGRTAADLAERLIALGRDEQTPVAVMCSVSRKDGAARYMCLRELRHGIDDERPVLIGIGAVFARNKNAVAAAFDAQASLNS